MADNDKRDDEKTKALFEPGVRYESIEDDAEEIEWKDVPALFGADLDCIDEPIKAPTVAEHVLHVTLAGPRGEDPTVVEVRRMLEKMPRSTVGTLPETKSDVDVEESAARRKAVAKFFAVQPTKALRVIGAQIEDVITRKIMGALYGPNAEQIDPLAGSALLALDSNPLIAGMGQGMLFRRVAEMGAEYSRKIAAEKKEKG